MKAQDSLWLIFSIIVLLVFAAVWIFKRLKLRRARTWPKREGRVKETQVRLEGSGTTQARYVAEVSYSYSVQGTGYSGRLRRRFLLHGSAHKWADTYATGRPLIVRYNPKNAKDSVLLENEQTIAPD